MAKAAKTRSTASSIRLQIERGGEKLWRHNDFRDQPFPAVAQTLSRLTRNGTLERLSKGVYYRPRKTAFGPSRPSPTAIKKLAEGTKTIFPSGTAAANLLGFTTQTPRRSELATSSLNLPRKLIGAETRVHARRPEAWKSLSETEAALLDFLRKGGSTSELSAERTIQKTLALLAKDRHIERLLKVAASEPPRVRALLGALAEELERDPAARARLRASLNPLSRFDFGQFTSLPHARGWQAKGKAKNVKLFEHPDFDQVILQTAEHFQLRPGIIEKDYYVTEVLRIIAATAGDKVIFKGGTSLSKGWNLIQRFSEAIDIFLDPLAFEPPLTQRGIDRELKSLRDAVAAHPALQFVPEESQTIGGFGRNDRFSYHQFHGGPGEVVNRVLLEAGAASGREPTENVELRSYLGQFLREKAVTLGTEDESSFPMRLLHFRRTFVEKMFAIHSKVEILKRDGRALGTYARHYYDLFQLASRSEILEMLQSAEYGEIKQDYDRISRTHFPGSYFYPDQMSFANSNALFATGDLAAAIGREYEGQCEILCFGPHPSWEIVQARFAELRNLL